MFERRVVSLVVLALVVFGCKREPPPERALGDTSAPAPAPQVQLSDSNIVALLSNTNYAEVNLARAAQPRLSAANVKAFATRMVAEHTAMQRQLDTLVTSRRLPPHDPPGGEREDASIAAQADSILRMSGRALDAAYVNQQIAAHRQALEDLRLFEGAARDDELRRLISRAIATVQAHLQSAMELARELSP